MEWSSYEPSPSMPSIPDESKQNTAYFMKLKMSLKLFGCEQQAEQKENVRNLDVHEVNKYLKALYRV